MATRIQLRRGTAAQWAAADPVLFAGEPAVETDTGKVKVGDGATAWAALPYILDEADLASSAALRAAYGTDVGDPQRAELDGAFAPLARGLLQGSGAPSGTVGVNGQMYWDYTNKTIYGPKSAGAWPAGNPLLGESISVQASLRGDTIPQPGYMPMGQGQRATAPGRAFFIRYVPPRSRALALASFITAVAATVDDPVEVAIYSAGATLTRLATTGQVTGKLNSTGAKTAPLTLTVDPANVYYVAIATATIGGTAGQISGASFQTADSALMYGTTPPNALAGFVDAALSAGLLPATIAASTITWGGITVFPAVALREV